jgi:redox-sensitive bicupin YhaK (pirin superfamily)
VLAGTVEHGDSLGNRGSLGSGDIQWMTAGSGILHQEMPQGRSAGPHARFPALGQSALVTENDRAAVSGRPGQGRARSDRRRWHRGAVVCGSFGGKTGPVDGVAAEPRYLDISVPPGVRKRLAVETHAMRSHTCLPVAAHSAMHLRRALCKRTSWDPVTTRDRTSSAIDRSC